MPLSLRVAALCSLAAMIGCGMSQDAPRRLAPTAGTDAPAGTIAFASTRDSPVEAVPFEKGGEIYLMNGDGTDVRRLTYNDVSDIFPSFSPDGRTIIFESNRRRAAGEPPNVSDLFVMKADGTEQTWLGRGSSASWSPDGKSIAFHASASGVGVPATPYPGSATVDSDIFVVNVRDWIEKKAAPRHLTSNPAAVDDDPDWSPDGRTILFTSHAAIENSTNATSAEIYVISAGATGLPKALTRNTHEERAPAWSPDGKRIAFSCRRGAKPDFDICIMNADGSGEVRLTGSPFGDLTPTWSPDGSAILFHRTRGKEKKGWDLWIVSADGGGESRLTDAPGYNGFASWSARPPRQE